MNATTIENLVYDAYQEDGIAGACKEADKHKICLYEFCDSCDCQVPTIKGDHGCLICGHETIKDPHIEDIPCENDENN